jgi:hypothetical protein
VFGGTASFCYFCANIKKERIEYMEKEKPLILVSNDDGVMAKGINELVKFLRPLGEIIVMAPDAPRSGSGCALTVTQPVHYQLVKKEVGLTVYKCSGTPTDCIKLARNTVLDLPKSMTYPLDSLLNDTVPPPAQDINKKIFIPNPTKATWLAVVFPGGGQIYNRKYWKLPIIYGGFAGCAYALSWNGKMYKDYSQAYLDIMDSNPNTKSYEDLLPPNSTYNEEQLKNTLKRRKDMFRRYRDLSIFAFIGVYLISIIDAYVDAELSNFDITPDLSMKVEPAVIDNNNQFRSSSLKNKSVGLQCVLRF